MAWPGNRVQQIVIAKLSLRLSLNNPSNIIWHCSKEICHTTTERERERESELEREREIEREREKERKKKEGKKEIRKEGKKERERERASWMPNAMVTANRATKVDFPSSVLPVLWLCTTVFAWLTPSLMDCRVWSQVIAFGGGLSLHSVSCTISDKQLLQY